MIPSALLEKYNLPVPRYTSYPTVPFWNNHIDIERWKNVFKKEFDENNHAGGISLYIHLPFCESLCTYCGCNKKITTNHKVETEYLNAVIKEWEMYTAVMDDIPRISEIHLGGGTPTFFSAKNLELLLNAILEDAVICNNHNFSFEGHPNNTTKEHLESLYKFGFRRVSYGVQDNNAEVQRIINRIQPFENVKRATEMARETGYESVNFDLIYGLPRQTPESIAETIAQCISLKPDRIAFYSYSHVPWVSRGQRLFDANDLPGAAEKIKLYQTGKELFLKNGYHDIGMDHFALPDDELSKAWNDGSLYRNFMGYTTKNTKLLLGLGVSAISDCGKAFAQNSKLLHEYYAHIANRELATEKGYFLNEEDEVFRKHILDISCKGETAFDAAYKHQLETFTFPELEKLRGDGLVEFDDKHARVTTLGKNFIRNICRAFDLHLLRGNTISDAPVFSKAI
ncbi:MAG: oxygen-independent coproporphyrinogen III oxidase [Bacteroidetes bacterium]|nr:oxygen-independent coproporphyrinogen III oxidase [Bacteroidota bacterium]